ncbi:MAG: hypothetical protein ACKVT1_01225 [Dehalococcoidia bacterium]
MIATADFVIANGGTVSNYVHMPGYRFVGLLAPTLTSTTLSLRVAKDAAATGAQPIHTNDHGSASAIRTLGNADTGAKYIPMPEAMGEAAAVAFVAVVAGSSQGADHAIR